MVTRPMSSFTFGTHNLHDEAGVPTFFADVVIFTEAIAPTVLALAKQKAAHARARLAGYSIVVCHQQPDLVVAFRRRLFKRRGPVSYKRYVDGVPDVTPNRGTGWLQLEHRATGLLAAVVFEHRINAAFPPYIRGEAEFRKRMWSKHTSGTCDLLDRLIDSGLLTLAGGDLNTPDRIQGYSTSSVAMYGLERGDHFDRLAVAGRARLVRRFYVSQPTYLSRKGSDHPRLRVTVRLPQGGR